MCSAAQNRRSYTKESIYCNKMGAHPIGGVLASLEAVPDLLGGEHILIAGGARLPGLRRICTLRIEAHKAAASPDL